MHKLLLSVDITFSAKLQIAFLTQPCNLPTNMVYSLFTYVSIKSPPNGTRRDSSIKYS